MLTTIKEEINGNTIIVRDFNTLLTAVDRSFTEKSVRKQLALNDILGEMEFKGMYRILILLRCTWNIPR